VEQHGMRHGGNFAVTATAQPGHTAAEIEAVIRAEVEPVRGARPPTVTELERARSFVETQLLRSIERQHGVAELLNTFEFLFHDPGQIEKRLLARYDAVTPADLARAAKDVLGAPSLTIAVEPQAVAKAEPKPAAKVEPKSAPKKDVRP